MSEEDILMLKELKKQKKVYRKNKKTNGSSFMPSAGQVMTLTVLIKMDNR